MCGWVCCANSLWGCGRSVWVLRDGQHGCSLDKGVCMRWCRHFVPVLAHTYFFEAMPSAASAAPILFGTGTWRVASHPEAQRKSPAFADDFRRAGDCGREIEALCAYFIEEVPQYKCQQAEEYPFRAIAGNGLLLAGFFIMCGLRGGRLAVHRRSMYAGLLIVACINMKSVDFQSLWLFGEAPCRCLTLAFGIGFPLGFAIAFGGRLAGEEVHIIWGRCGSVSR